MACYSLYLGTALNQSQKCHQQRDQTLMLLFTAHSFLSVKKRMLLSSLQSHLPVPQELIKPCYDFLLLLLQLHFPPRPPTKNLWEGSHQTLPELAFYNCSTSSNIFFCVCICVHTTCIFINIYSLLRRKMLLNVLAYLLHVPCCTLSHKP